MERQLELSSQINEEKSRLWKEERENELRSVTERLTTERNKIEAKYRDFKNSVKESEGVLKKQITDLGKEKAVVE